jgi:hypothetical protein
MPARISPLLNRVQNIRVTSDGPQWEMLPADAAAVQPPCSTGVAGTQVRS